MTALAILAYMLGQRSEVVRRSGTKTVPIVAPLQEKGTPDETESSEPPRSSETVSRAPATEDRALTQLLTAQSASGGHILAAFQDPRNNFVTLTYSLNADENEREVGAELARFTLNAVPSALQVTLRAVRSDRLAYMADVNRARLQESETETWRQANPGMGAWISYVLQNEWRSPSEAEEPSAPVSTPPATSPTPTDPGSPTHSPVSGESTPANPGPTSPSSTTGTNPTTGHQDRP